MNNQNYFIKTLLNLGLHIGHSKFNWNPKISSYVIGTTYNNYLIFNIFKTCYFLKKALTFIKLVGYNNGKFLIYTPSKSEVFRFNLEGVFDKEGIIPSSYPFVHSIVKPGFFSNWKTNYKRLFSKFFIVIFQNKYFFGNIIVRFIENYLTSKIQSEDDINNNIGDLVSKNIRFHKLYHKVKNIYSFNKLNNLVEINKKNKIDSISSNNTNLNFGEVMKLYTYYIRLSSMKKSDLLMSEGFKILYYNIYFILMKLVKRKYDFNYKYNRLVPKEINFFRRLIKFILIFRYLKRLKYIPTAILFLNPEQHKSQLTDFKNLNVSIISLLDTNSQLDNISYFIPMNDDSIINNLFLMKLFNLSYEEGKKTSILNKFSTRISYSNILSEIPIGNSVNEKTKNQLKYTNFNKNYVWRYKELNTYMDRKESRKLFFIKKKQLEQMERRRRYYEKQRKFKKSIKNLQQILSSNK